MWLTTLLILLRSALLIAWLLLRPVLGWLLIVIGLIGMPMPIVNGVIPLAIGIMLVGQRNWLIRWSRVQIKLLLAWWASLATPVVGPLGRLARRSARAISRQNRRLRWWMMERHARRRSSAERA